MNDFKGKVEKENNTYLIFNLAGQSFAVHSLAVHEVRRLPEIRRIPISDEHVAGVVNIRGEVIPAVDLRKLLGFRTVAEDKRELISMLREREVDHLNWVSELEASVREKRKFGLSRDPHTCKFGAWYDTYKTDDFGLSLLLGQFNLPHQEIHHLADLVEAKMESGAFDEAISIIETKKKTVLSRLILLFRKLYPMIEISETRRFIVCSSRGSKIGLIVDGFRRIDEILPANISDVEKMSGGSKERMGRLEEGLVRILDPDNFSFSAGG